MRITAIRVTESVATRTVYQYVGRDKYLQSKGEVVVIGVERIEDVLYQNLPIDCNLIVSHQIDEASPWVTMLVSADDLMPIA